MTRAPLDTDRTRPRVQLDGADRRECLGIEKLDALAAIGNQQPMRLRDWEDAVGGLETFDAAKMLTGVQIEHFEGAVILGREKQPVTLKIDGEVIEVPAVPGQLGAPLQHQNRI